MFFLVSDVGCCRGNVVLMGDAVHPMMPNLGQGGCQAIEEKWRGTMSDSGVLRWAHVVRVVRDGLNQIWLMLRVAYLYPYGSP